MSTSEPAPPFPAVTKGVCARCDKPASGRYCDQHRREHAEHLRGQIEGVLADHQRNREAARAKAVARMTCGHGADAVTTEGHFFICGECAQPTPSAPAVADAAVRAAATKGRVR